MDASNIHRLCNALVDGTVPPLAHGSASSRVGSLNVLARPELSLCVLVGTGAEETAPHVVPTPSELHGWTPTHDTLNVRSVLPSNVWAAGLQDCAGPPPAAALASPGIEAAQGAHPGHVRLTVNGVEATFDATVEVCVYICGGGGVLFSHACSIHVNAGGSRLLDQLCLPI